MSRIVGDRVKRIVGERVMDFGKKIVAVGKNYESHAKEMQKLEPARAAPPPALPVIFLKPTSSYVREPGAIQVPSTVKDLHHEVELGVVIGKEGRDISVLTAMDHVAGYVLALDMTARDIQSVAKAAGLPWTIAKGYDTFTPISKFIPASKIPDWKTLELWCKVDGELRQKGYTKDMIYSVPQLISYISSIMTLEVGDMISTGTPAGVGPVAPGQVITAGITDVIEMSFPVEHRPVGHTWSPEQDTP
mmetsp:Transcript_8376/g.14369  ORF Transcript_8376/g.14369 Transcript_8376/m.14369 type:complete len:247 (-) Transcript_8376:72-812(-)|eukprot:CAMPEP_0196656194 /NCGR_PEP_ID=MMETSP1086-20130531/13657_1 /TAXON_ID=77921 /ORGANISM="Cyanoptyche  gloeocystis , Strain SAG4.97" /LENGTH=246 /DNA_ID=CAMNT_0041988829 /DNA_START=76 /DNA_END=816 /DNA_ORIENTATION=+